MTLDNKINDLNLLLEESLNLLNDLSLRSDNQEEKAQISEVIETHIAYMVFLKELEIEINKKSKSITKELLIQQFNNIQQSCKLVKKIYSEYV
jgi:hypothetical protein